MTDKEFAEIKKRFKSDKGNIAYIRGCYVSAAKEIISRFKVPVNMLNDEQQDWVLKLMKKSISGAMGRNLMNIEFTTDQVESGEEYKLLSEIRESELDNEELLDALYEKIVSSFVTDGNYLILLAYDRYDVPSFSKNDEDLMDSTEMFRYFICSVCPIKITRAALGFSTGENNFRNIGAESAVSAPEIGFMYPCFDDRKTNIYNAVFYTRSTKENYAEVVEALFGAKAQMPAAEQKQAFRNVVSDSTSESRNLGFVQSVHSMISDMITEHKESKDPEPLMLDKNDVKRVLTTCGAKDEEMASFDENFINGFGEKIEIPPQNIIDPKQFELKNSYVSIKVDPKFSFMVDAKVVDGVKYIMIRADEGVEVNGIGIHFDGEQLPQRVITDNEAADTDSNTENTSE